MSDKQTIREAFFALCEYQNPSLTKDQKRMALGRCWKILSSALRANQSMGALPGGEDRELP